MKIKRARRPLRAVARLAMLGRTAGQANGSAEVRLMTTASASPGRRRVLVLLAATALTTCAPRRPAGTPLIDVFAAASLREVLDAAAAEHRQQTGRIVRATYAGSAKLARQIAQGAPADLFISADERWMDWLGQRGLVDTSAQRRLASNALVLVAPVSASGDPVDLSSSAALIDRLGGNRLAIADSSTPAGRYGEQALVRLNLWSGVKDRRAPADDVRAALSLVSRGEVPLGLVYATDARAEPRVRVVATFPSSSHDPIVYPAAPVRRRDRAGDPAAAQAFLDMLAGAEGEALFRRFGFAPAQT
jgi:molybdate transport system substrate-binding protein